MNDNAIQALLQFVNGDWRGSRIQHFCRGRDCCRDLAHAKEQVFAALCGVDVTHADESKLPSVDDWGSCGHSAATALFGFGCHRVLPRLVEHSIPHYRRNIQVNDHADGATLYRAKLTKKLNRVKWWISDDGALVSLLAYGLCGPHFEKLMKTLDKIDQVPFGIFVLFDRKTNPFVQARQGLTRLLESSREPLHALQGFTTGVLGGKAALDFDHGRAFVLKVRLEFNRVCLDMQLQISWRFKMFDLDPFQNFACIAPQISERDAFASLQATFSGHSCCQFRGSTQKIVNVFAGDARRALTDECFRWSLQSAAYSFRFTNMCMERSLAQAAKADDHRVSPYAERACCNPLLSEVLHDHLNIPGRRDPRVTVRAELQERGMPINAGGRAVTADYKREGVPGFAMFKREKGVGMGKMKQAEYYAWMRELGKEYAALDLDRQKEFDAARRLFVSKARRDAEDKAEIEKQQAGVDRARTGLLQSVVSELGSCKEPFPKACFQAVVAREVQASLGTPIEHLNPDELGFTRYAPLLRGKLMDRLWQADLHDIAEDEVFDYGCPCTLAHPGLCKTDIGPAKMQRIFQACKHFHEYIRMVEMNSVIRILCSNTDGVALSYVGALVHFRGSNPKFAALAALADVPLGIPGLMEYAISEFGTIIFELDVTIIGGLFFRTDVARISVQTLLQDESKCGDHILPQPMQFAKASKVEIWPEQLAKASAEAASAGGHGGPTLAKVLKASRALLVSEESKPPPAKRRCGAEPAAPVAPEFGAEAASGGGAADSDEDDVRSLSPSGDEAPQPPARLAAHLFFSHPFDKKYLLAFPLLLTYSVSTNKSTLVLFRVYLRTFMHFVRRVNGAVLHPLLVP